ncbi:multidrug effflux MFS transporter [Endozoicomonas sp. Mp262]|uniref:CmlA/FloR family chloramphenicol efflux MFS transporter n=1 Tax=Endozoicomonas sp. Mp262 TaxID=2919499 RepID=UPI0021DA60F2
MPQVDSKQSYGEIVSLKNRWRLSLQQSLLLMVPFDLLASLGMDAYLPAIPDITDTFSAPASTVQLTLSLYMLVLGLGQLFFGPLSDRYGRRPILLGGNLLFIFSSIGLTLAPGIEAFIILRVFQGIGASATLVATFAAVRDAFGHQKESTTIYALLGAMLAFVPAFGPMIGAIIITLSHWKVIFLILAGIAICAGIHAFFRWPETSGNHIREPLLPIFKSVISSPKFWLFTLAFSVAMGSFFVYFSIAPYILIERLGYSPASFSLLFACAALAMIVTSRFVGQVVEHLGTNNTLKLGMSCILSGAIAMAIAGYFLNTSAASFIIPMLLVAVGISCTCAVSANGALSDFPKTAGTAVAFYYCIEAVIVSVFGSLVVTLLPPNTVWPLVVFCVLGVTIVLAAIHFIND